MKFGTDVM